MARRFFLHLLNTATMSKAHTDTATRKLKMGQSALSLLVVTLLFSGSSPLNNFALLESLHDTSVSAQAHTPIAELGKLPLSFEPNVGQTDSPVRYMAHAPSGNLLFTPSEVALVLHSPSVRTGIDNHAQTASQPLSKLSPVKIDRNQVESPSLPPSTVHLQFIGANPAATLEATGEQPGKVNYFIGNDPRYWHANVPTYGGITYKALYPGVDLNYMGASGQLKGTYIVAPGADPTSIRYHYEGAENVSVDEAGNLQVRVAQAMGSTTTQISTRSTFTVTEQVPVAWQEIAGQEVAVQVKYDVGADNTVSFILGSYNHAAALILDPTLSYSTYLGGSADDVGLGIATDGTGNTYITGITHSNDFPIANPFQPALAANLDVFVSKINAAGSALIYSTYLGGNDYDQSNGIAVDGSGNAYVTGRTNSSDFPTANAFQPNPGPGGSAFVTKINTEGSTLIYSTYLGGHSCGYCANTSSANSIAVDTAGEAYVTGATQSNTFPVTPGVVQPQLVGGYDFADDAFITKFSANGSSLIYSTYLGGNGEDIGKGIAVDGSGNAYVTGRTNSTDFPTANAFQPVFGGDQDAFVTKINPAGSAFVYSTYLGGGINLPGSQDDEGNAIAADGSGNAYVTGMAHSGNFPTVNAVQPQLAGGHDAFITKFNTSGSVIYSTYLGGSASDNGDGIAVDRVGDAYVAGNSVSDDFPTVNPSQPTRAGDADAFVTVINANGSSLIYSTYLGGSGHDEGSAIATDGSGNIYITGSTHSTAPVGFPIVNPLQPANHGGYDAFVTKIAALGGPPAPNSQVVAIEVNQVVQDWRNSVDLVSGKNTVVRVHIQSFDPVPSPVRWFLRGTRNGVDLPASPLTPDNIEPVVPQRDPEAARATIYGTLNYVLPPSWISGGTITLSVVDPAHASVPCGGSILPPTGCNQSVYFLSPSVVRLVLVPIQITYGGRPYTPSTYDVEETIDRLRDVYPVPGVGAEVIWGKSETVPFDDPHFIDNVEASLQTLQGNDTGRPYFALIPDPVYIQGRRVGQFVEVTGNRPSSVGYVESSSTVDFFGEWSPLRYDLGHEMGHALGLPHPLSSFGGQPYAYCGEDHPENYTPPVPPLPIIHLSGNDFRQYPPPPAPAYEPWSFSTYRQNTAYALGPINSAAPENEIWGLNVRAFNIGDNLHTVVNPYQTFPMMSYCIGMNTQGQGNWMWPAYYEYEQILRKLQGGGLFQQGSQSHSARTATAQDLLVRGTLDHTNGDTVTFKPLYRVPAGDTFPTSEPGPYSIELRDGAGQVLTSTTFNIETSGPPPPQGTPGPIPPQQESFLVVLPDDPGGQDVRMLSNGVLVGERHAGAQTPSVTLLAPMGGEHIAGNLDTRWQTSGGSGPLTVAVYYSRDGGASWRTLAADLTGNEYSIDSQLIGGSNDALIRVEVSDGFLTAKADSSLFTVAPSAPLAHIITPQGVSVFSQTAVIHLEAEGFDKQDQTLPDNAFQWSFEGGVLGTGARLDVPASQFSPGGHTFTITARNSSGLSGQDHVTVIIGICPLQFIDIPSDNPFYSYVRCLVCSGVLGGYGDGTFRPGNNITRGQLSKIVSNAAVFDDPAGAQIFEDVAPGSPFYDWVQRLASRGFIGGYACGGSGEPCGSGSKPYFRPGNNATRGQISKIVSNTQGYSDPAGTQIFQDVPPGSPFYDWVQRLASRSVMGGYSCGGAGEPCVGPTNRPYFRPGNNASRGQVSKIVANTFFPNCQTP